MSALDINVLLAAILLALGISIPPPNFAGGFLIAVGFAYGIRAMRQTEGQRGLWITLFIGGLVAIIAAITHTTFEDVWLWGGLPVQAQMGLAGALSQSIAEGAIKFGRKLSEWMGNAADHLPTGGDK